MHQFGSIYFIVNLLQYVKKNFRISNNYVQIVLRSDNYVKIYLVSSCNLRYERMKQIITKVVTDANFTIFLNTETRNFASTAVPLLSIPS